MTVYFTLTFPPSKGEHVILYSYGSAFLLGVLAWIAYAFYGAPDWLGSSGFMIAFCAMPEFASRFLLAQDWTRSFTTPPTVPRADKRPS